MDSSFPDKPPVFKSWRAWYLIVLGVLAIQIIIFSVLSNIF